MSASRKQALLNGEKQYFTGNPCKHGHIAFRRAATGECIECRAVALQVWRKQHPEAVKRHNDTQYLKYPELKHKWGQRNKKYATSHKAQTNARTIAYQLSKAQRIPVWVDQDALWMMKEAYDLAVKRSKMTGFAWHVDHIIPLRGATVSGLHTPNNLQVIPGVQNVAKGNRY